MKKSVFVEFWPQKTGLNGDYLRKGMVLLEQQNNVTAADYERLLF